MGRCGGCRRRRQGAYLEGALTRSRSWRRAFRWVGGGLRCLLCSANNPLPAGSVSHPLMYWMRGRGREGVQGSTCSIHGSPGVEAGACAADVPGWWGQMAVVGARAPEHQTLQSSLSVSLHRRVLHV